MMKTTVKVDQLSFAYDQAVILKNIQLAVKKSEFVTIIGPNGSGKTTLLKHIGKLITPPEKAVFLNGSDITALSTKQMAKQVSLLAQYNQYDYDYSCYDIVMMGRFVHLNTFKGETKADIKIVEQSMHDTGTWQFRNRAITELSGGERQRVALARNMAQDADIILLDEPITFLDIQHQIEVMKNIKRFAKKYNKTVIAVLHDLNFALKFSDRLILLSDGQIISAGTPNAVLTEDNIKNAYGIAVKLVKKEGELDYIVPIID